MNLITFVAALTAIVGISFAIGRRLWAFGVIIFALGNELIVEGVFFDHPVTIFAGMLVGLVGGIMYLARPRKTEHSKQIKGLITYREPVD
jgi:hypothetical protein